MDSDTTLVNHAPPISYFLSSTNLKDAVIYAQPGLPLYRVTSDTKQIKIYSTTPTRLIAILNRREPFPDTISLPQRRPNSSLCSGAGTHVNIQRWLKRSKLPDGTSTFTVDTEYGPYVWKPVSRHRHNVFAGSDLEKAVASCCLHPSLPPNKPAFILQPEGEPIRDDVVVIYVVQRHRIMLESHAVDLFVGFGFVMCYNGALVSAAVAAVIAAYRTVIKWHTNGITLTVYSV